MHMWSVRQYSWHDLDGYVMDKRGNPQTPIHKYLDQETYDMCLKHLANNKTSGLDKIPDAFMKNLPASFHKLLSMFSPIVMKRIKSQPHGK